MFLGAVPILQHRGQSLAVFGTRRLSAVHPERQRECRAGKVMLLPETFQPAGRKMTPANVSPIATKRQSAMSSLPANATINPSPTQLFTG